MESKEGIITNQIPLRKTNFYSSIHKWVRRNWGKANHCALFPEHKAKRFEWANISGEYKKDSSDWMELCPSCHKKIDIDEDYRKNMSRAKTGVAIKGKAINQFTLDGILIKTWKSGSEAARTLCILEQGISATITGKLKKSGGFIWRLANDGTSQTNSGTQ